MHRGFRYRLYPTDTQAETLGQWVGVCRLVYNLALEQRRDFHRQFRRAEGRAISWVSQSREITDLRREHDWIAAVSSTALIQVVRDLDKAFAAFFSGRAGYPTPRRLGVNDAFRVKGCEVAVCRVTRRWSEVSLPKIGRVRFRDTRERRGELANVTVSRHAGHWFVSFACDIGEPANDNAMPSVGIDRGVANTLTLSTGEHLRMTDLTALDRRRRRAQRALSRKRRGSKRYAKQRLRVARLSAKTARARRHWNHVQSTRIAARFGVVALEDLKIRNMTASAAGTVEEPGRNVRQKAGLNRAILNQAWYQFEVMLAYKLEATGGRLVFVPAPFTSQTCAECGVVDGRSRESQAVFRCVACGHEDHADINAARNIQRGSTAFVEEGHWSSGEARTLAA